jgi:hypothetical protein
MAPAVTSAPALHSSLTDALTGSQNGSDPCPHYPFAFKCAGCDEETTVERSDARGLAPNPDSMSAVEIVLDERGWLQDEIDGRLLCPGCTDVAT